jgi:hypothetical protein
LAKIALWKILVQLVFRLVQLVFKYWFSWYSNTGSAGFQAGSTGIQKPINRFLDQLSRTLN